MPDGRRPHEGRRRWCRVRSPGWRPCLPRTTISSMSKWTSGNAAAEHREDRLARRRGHPARPGARCGRRSPAVYSSGIYVVLAAVDDLLDETPIERPSSARSGSTSRLRSVSCAWRPSVVGDRRSLSPWRVRPGCAGTIAPIVVSRPSMSSWPQPSTTLPSTTRSMPMVSTLTFLPVAGVPMNSPRWVPSQVEPHDDGVADGHDVLDALDGVGEPGPPREDQLLEALDAGLDDLTAGAMDLEVRVDELVGDLDIPLVQPSSHHRRMMAIAASSCAVYVLFAPGIQSSWPRGPVPGRAARCPGMGAAAARPIPWCRATSSRRGGPCPGRHRPPRGPGLRRRRP